MAQMMSVCVYIYIRIYIRFNIYEHTVTIRDDNTRRIGVNNNSKLYRV